MKEKVLVTVKSEIVTGEDVDEIEIMQVGSCADIRDILYVKYDEVMEDEGTPVSNLVKIDDKNMHVEITKKGVVCAHLDFTLGKKTTTFYDTAFGTINMGLHTRAMEIEKNDDGVRVYLEYALEVNYETVSENRVTIEVKKGK